jgi:hypothetical protein
MKHIVALALGAALLGGCAPQTRFEWGSYQESLYLYAKAPDQRDAYRQSLQDAIDKGKQTNRLAPGLQAELGYLYLEEGDRGRAIQLFEAEMAQFPESKPFLTDMIKRLQGVPPTAAAAPEVQS